MDNRAQLSPQPGHASGEPRDNPVGSRQLEAEQHQWVAAADVDAVHCEPAVLSGHGERDVIAGREDGLAGGGVVFPKGVGEWPCGLSRELLEFVSGMDNMSL